MNVVSKSNEAKVVTLLAWVNLTLFAPNLLAHSEHDKARFVAENGQDMGNCGNRFRPCKTIAYAQLQAKKGDKILVAQGNYPVTSAFELLSLTDAINPVYGGYSTIDNYQVQSSETNKTTLVGVPANYRAMAQRQGFNVIVDTKSLEFREALSEGEQLIAAKQQRKSDVACSNGQAGFYPCDNVSLVSHVPLNEFSATEANDIWGHQDLNTGIEYAIIGLRNGVAVVSLADPENPGVVGKITQQNTTWRDVKVLQYFDDSSNQWQAYAYVTADSASNGLTIVDLNDLPNSIAIANTDYTDREAHNVYISNVDYTLNIAAGGEPGLHILGPNNFFGAMRTYSLADPANPTVAWRNPTPQPDLYTHDASSVVIKDERATSQCVNANDNGCTVMLDFNEGEVLLWDHTDITDAQQLSSFTYSTASYVHSGWWSDDRNYIFVHDELDERNRFLNTTVYVFDITDLNSPLQVSTWEGPTKAVDHNGFVRGNRYYMSNYERGLTILDITDPTSPESVGFFDTFPIRNSSSFNGAWGVYPFLQSGLILVSDINSGLFVLRDETRTGTLGFTQTSIDMEEGETATISVEKSFEGSTSVSYEVFTGTASKDDFQLQNGAIDTGTLEWSANENEPQTFTIEALADDISGERTESLYVRLMDPKNGASLSNNNLLEINIKGGEVNRGVVSFADSQITVLENQGTASIQINRMQGNDGAISINYGPASLNSDLVLEAGTLSWQAGSAEPKTIEFGIVDDNETENTETWQIRIASSDSSLLGSTTLLDIQIRDDESNVAPSVSLPDNFSTQTNQLTSVTANGSDPEGDTLTWQWTQISGPETTLLDSDSQQVMFTMPGGEIVLQASATDDFGVATTAQITISEALLTPPPPVPPTPPSKSSQASEAGNIPLHFLLTGLLLVMVRRFQGWDKKTLS